MQLPANTTLPPRNTRFVGQEARLWEVEQKLQSRRRIALVGIGGIGKSQLAIEVAHRAQRNANKVQILFASAQSELHLEQSYSKFAIDNKLTTSKASISSQCQAVKAFLESDSTISWLVIFDGADNAKIFFGPREFYKLLPQTTNGSIIFTTRSSEDALHLVPNEKDLIRLARFSADDATKLFQTRLSSTKYHLAHVLEVVELLRGVPLALSQAATYIAKYCGSVDKYVSLYRAGEVESIALLSEGGSHEDGSVDKPVVKTWQISFERIKRDHRDAAHLLCFAACVNPHQIPITMLPRTQNNVDVTTALGILKAHCMISEEDSKETFDMHPLIHLMARHWLSSEGQLDQYTRLAFDAVYECFPAEFRSQEQITQGNLFSTHAQTLIGKPLPDYYGESHAELASRFARYLCMRGDFGSAVPCLQQAIELSAAIHGLEEPPTLAGQNQLALVKFFLEEYREAEQLASQVLELRKKILGDEHQDTLSTQSNLALIFHCQGKWSDAESLQRQTLRTRARTLGPNHDDTLKSLNNLGLSLKRLQRFEEAETLFREVFQERMKTLGKVDADTLGVMNNLGLVLEHRGKFDEALEFLYAVVVGKESLLGSRHPEVLKSKQNIAVVLTSQGAMEEAEAMTRAVIKGYAELSLGKHSDALYAQQCLVDILKGRGAYVEASRICRQVFEAREAKLGESHPETVFSRRQWKELEDSLELLPN